MATALVINGKTETRPGIYSTIMSGIKNPPLNLSYGNICIVDTGVGAGYGGGSGVAGILNTGAQSIVEFTSADQMRSFMKGGILWDLAEPLFRPSNRSGVRGVSKVFYIRAAATTQASCTLSFATASGSAVFKAKDEGVNANGSFGASGTTLRKGYGLKFVAGTIDATKYQIEFWAGTYKGIDVVNGLPYDEVIETNCVPIRIHRSPEMSTIAELAAWCNKDAIFQKGFSVVITGGGAFVAGDLATNSGFVLFSGATETYSNTNTDLALEATRDTDCTFYLANDYGATAASVSNTKLSVFLQSGLKYEKFGFIGGGIDSTKLSVNTIGSSDYTANYFNSDRINIVHGRFYKTGKDGGSLILKSTLYKAAMYLGRVCGLEPQTPVTFKELNIAKELHVLSIAEQEYALSKGVVYTYYDLELNAFIVGQGVTSLQNNNYLVNEDASSPDLAVKRIASQLNKELIFNAKRTFFGKNEGPNRATITPEDVKSWLKGFLDSKTATTLNDNLLIRHGNYTVAVDGDSYSVTYEFVPNFPVHKIAFTGFMLDK